MENYSMEQKFECAWPSELVWVNPSPNAASVNMARCFSGTVLLEGTNLSEGRGTTHPLEMIGAPNFDTLKILSWMKEKAPQWMTGCRIRPCYFEPTFHKHQGKLCSGFQIHAEGSFYDSTKFSPFRLIALYLKAVKTLYPGFELWRDFPYEYETNRLAIDVINGGPRLREWVEDLSATCAALEATLSADEQTWLNERKNFLIY